MSAFPHEWLNLHLWPLLLLALVPLLIHWLDRRRAPTVDWPGIRFLLVGGERAIRRLERRDLILLVVRTIAIAAILIATLRPRAEMAPGPLLGPGRAATVVVLDTSLSMTARSPSSSERRFDRARNAALRVLERLGPEDLVRVVPLPAADVAQPTDPLPPDAARQIVRAITPGGAGFDISEALRIGIEEVSALPAAERAVWIFTDLEPPPSGQDLSARRELLRRFVADLDPPPAVHLVDAGDPDAWNVAITALEPEGIALGTDEPARFHVRLEASAKEPRDVPLRVTAGPTIVHDDVARVSADRALEIELAPTFPAPGPAIVTAETGPDSLEADDRRSRAVRVLERIDVLVRDASLGRDERSGDAVLRALWPRILPRSPPPTILRPQRVERIERSAAESAEVILLCDVPAPGSDEAMLLDELVREGRGLIVFCGPDADPAAYETLLFRGGAGVLPARIAANGPSGSPGAVVHPRIDPRSHPIFAVFGGGDQGDIELIRVARHREIEAFAPGARAIARLGDGAPWIVERAYGRGRALLVTTSADERDSDLVRTPLFPPLVHRLVRYAAMSSEAEQHGTVGEPLAVELPPDRATDEVTLIAPDGASEILEAPEGTRSVRIPPPRRPGLHRIEGTLVDGSPFVITLPVDLPLSESRLERFDAETLSTLTDALGARVIAASDLGDAWQDGDAARTIEYFPLLALLALALLLVEVVLARVPRTNGDTDEARPLSTGVSSRHRREARTADL